MASRRTPRPCACGACYEDLRTGLTFGEVRQMLYNVPDPRRSGWWRQKRRSAVLGFWRQLKLDMWDLVHKHCEMEMAA